MKMFLSLSCLIAFKFFFHASTCMILSLDLPVISYQMLIKLSLSHFYFQHIVCKIL